MDPQDGHKEKKYIIETNGSGMGLIDYDNDGWLDIYVVNGSTFDALDGKETPPHAALFHNNHDGTFTEVAAKAGVTNDRWGLAALCRLRQRRLAGYSVANWGKNRLYHNNHDGTFTDVAERPACSWATGQPARHGATTTATGGLVDLFVPGYVHFDRNDIASGGENGVPDTFCTFRRRASELADQGRAGPSVPQQLATERSPT